MFALAEEGYTSVFQQLIACILSIRTRDEVSLVAARRLFTAAAVSEDLTGLVLEEIDRLIGWWLGGCAVTSKVDPMAAGTHQLEIVRTSSILDSRDCGVMRQLNAPRRK
jgi:hypothetical protein